MTVAVTGATGFIGRHLVAHLVKSGVDVRAIVRRNSSSPPVSGAAIVTSPLETAPLVDAFHGADTVVHLAGVVGTVRPRDYTDVNVNGTRAVAEAARTANARLIHISSLSVAGPASAAAPSSEADPPNPMTPYGVSKLEGERIVGAMSGLRWTILRPAIVYGPADRGLLPLFQWARRGVLPLAGRRDAAYTLVHVSDVVRAIDAARSGAADGEVLYVGHPRIVTTPQLFEALQAAVGRRALIVRIPEPVTSMAALLGEGIGRLLRKPMPLSRTRARELRASGFLCRVDRLRERLGVTAQVDIDEGFADTAAWYVREQWL